MDLERLQRDGGSRIAVALVVVVVGAVTTVVGRRYGAVVLVCAVAGYGAGRVRRAAG